MILSIYKKTVYIDDKDGRVTNKFNSEKYSERIIRIKGIDTTASYLVCGKDKNCLIDTGMGYGSLKDYIEKELNKKVDFVILTHGHLDH